MCFVAPIRKYFLLLAFHFCIEYKRRTEFRKLCDIVRHEVFLRSFITYYFPSVTQSPDVDPEASTSYSVVCH